jgi:hypothetical protein
MTKTKSNHAELVERFVKPLSMRQWRRETSTSHPKVPIFDEIYVLESTPSDLGLKTSIVIDDPPRLLLLDLS